jgi:tripartite-type tricarboxylate transporter receptor subunit TctC
LLADRFGKLWNQQVLIDNVSGAGGGVAALNVARSKPDGYTVFFATHPIFAINPFVYEKLSYDPDADFIPVVKLSEAPLVLLVHASLGVQTLPDLIKLAKEKPGTINFGSGGVGTSQHLSAEMLKATASIDIVHIPYRGTGPASKALLANEIQMHFDGVHSATGQMATGRIRGIAVTSLNRLSTLPDLPTMSETLNGFEATLAYGLLVPAGTPQALVTALNRDANKVLQDPAFRKQMQDAGISLQGGTPEQFKAFLANERRKWGDLLRRLNIKAS